MYERSSDPNMTSLFNTSDHPDDLLVKEAIDKLLAEGVEPEDIGARLEAALPGVMKAAGVILLHALKKNAASMLADREKIRDGFQKRQQAKWGEPLDLLMMLMEASRESGQEFNSMFQGLPQSQGDFVFDALRRLHARACLIASEIHWMLTGGYASGAMARWRTLHELAVVSYFIKKHGQDTAEQFLRHHESVSYNEAIHYNNYLVPLGFEAVSDEELQELKTSRDTLCSRFGREYHKDWGWACKALNLSRVTFADLEKSVSLEHYRPHFKLASNANHAGSKGIWFDLGNSLNPPGSPVMLAGPSDAGLADPGMCTAISLNQITNTLILHANITATTLAVAECLSQLTDETRDAFVLAQQNLEDWAARIQAGEPNPFIVRPFYIEILSTIFRVTRFWRRS